MWYPPADSVGKKSGYFNRYFEGVKMFFPEYSILQSIFFGYKVVFSSKNENKLVLQFVVLHYEFELFRELIANTWDMVGCIPGEKIS